MQKVGLRVLLQDDRLSGVGRLALLDSTLIIVERQAPYIHIVSLPDGTIRWSGIGQGGGPMEMSRPGPAGAAGAAGYAWVFDLGRMRLLRLSPADVLTGNLTRGLRFTQLATEPFLPTEPVLLSDRIVSLTVSESEASDRFVILDPEGKQLGVLPSFTDRAADSSSVESTVGPGDLRPAQLVPAPDGNGFAQIGLTYPQVRFFRGDGVLLAEAVPPEEIAPRSAPEQGLSRVITPSTRLAYVAGASGPGLLAVLYSGSTVGQAGFGELTGSQIHLFEWFGEFIGAVSLDGDYSGIAIAADGSTAFFYRSLPAPAILSAELGELQVPRGRAVRAGPSTFAKEDP